MQPRAHHSHRLTTPRVLAIVRVCAQPRPITTTSHSRDQAKYHGGTFFIPGSDLPNIFGVRTPRDAHAIERLVTPSHGRQPRVIIVGSSFIGMEVAAYLAQVKKITDITVVGMEAVPFERVLGNEIGEGMRAIHEELGGIKFQVGRTVQEFTRGRDGRVGFVVLDNSERLPCDLVIVGAGEWPRRGKRA